MTAPRSVFRVYGYLNGVFERGLRWWRVDFERIGRGTGLSRRTIEAALAFIRQHWPARFEFRRLRVGRLWHVEVWDRKNRPPSPKPLSPRAFPSEKTALKHAGAGLGLSPAGADRLRRLGAFLARHRLAPLHWDNCKVVFRFAHAFRFAVASLERGFDKRSIETAYDRALHQRHADAVDWSLSVGRPLSLWEPSSTVSLANRLLESTDRQIDSDRIRDRLTALEPAKRANEQLRALCRAAFA